MAQKGRPKKEQWQDLPQEWKDRVNTLSREELEHEIANVAYNNCELMKLKSEDMDLASCKQSYTDAGAQYKEGSKQNKLKISYAKEMLDSAGGLTKST